MRPLLATYAWLLARLPEAFARANAALLGELLWLIRGKDPPQPHACLPGKGRRLGPPHRPDVVPAHGRDGPLLPRLADALRRGAA